MGLRYRNMHIIAFQSAGRIGFNSSLNKLVGNNPKLPETFCSLMNALSLLEKAVLIIPKMRLAIW
jgi:hypothetical protein